MSDKRKPSNLAWLVQVEDRYGQKVIHAAVVQPQDNGELYAPGRYRFDDGHEFSDFNVTAYLGWNGSIPGTASETPGTIWGLAHDFTPHSVNAEQAADMVKIFRKVERGLAKAVTDSGYVQEGDFFTYLTRIAAAVGIRSFYVRRHRESHLAEAEPFRKVDAPTLQQWIWRTSELAETKPGDLIVRGA